MSEPSVPPPPPPYYTPPPPTGPTSGGVSPNRTIMIVLSYLWLLALIPLLTEKDDKEVQWHAKHGLVLFVAEFILWVAFIFLHMMLIALHIGIIGCFLSILQLILWLGILVLHILCIVKGTKGERLIVPGVSQFADGF